jgi:hypothetical protein
MLLPLFLQAQATDQPPQQALQVLHENCQQCHGDSTAMSGLSCYHGTSF